jgi:hypothetical protein
MATEQSVHSRRDAGLDGATEFVRPVTRENGSSLIWQFGVLVLMWAAMAMLNVASSEHLSWHQKSLSYDVFLGVVPASVVQQDEKLARLHGMAANAPPEHAASTYHLLVTAFRRSGTERVVDADVLAEVVENDLIHVKRTKKPLKLMSVDGADTYCNFFDLHWNGKYRIHVVIREPGKNLEKVTFLQELHGLSD